MLNKTIFLSCMVLNLNLLHANFPESRGSILDVQGIPTMLTPIGGYISKKDNIPEGVGQKGLQKFYNLELASGIDVQTTIHSQLQRHTERMLDKTKLIVEADEVLAMVMDSKTGAMLTMATSNRYDPLYIRRKDVPSLNHKFTEYPYEPGGVMMPFTVATAVELDESYVERWINTDYDKFQISENAWISDHYRQTALRPVDILVSASSVGTAKVALDIPATTFHDAFTRYGFGVKSGIDLPRDLEGVLKSEVLLEGKMHRANTSYGYGMMATPMQLLKAYSMFANDGWIVTPHIAKQDEIQRKKVLSKTAVGSIKKMLIEVVKRGTGKNAQMKGLTIGGKTGTAHIAELGRYVKKYHSSFYGFVEDSSGHSYTIGVLVIDAKAPKEYFASRSAVPVFKNVVKKMVRLGLVVPSIKKRDKQVKKLYVDDKTVSPIRNGKVVLAFGEHVDKITNRKVFNESVSIKAFEDKTVFNVLSGKVVYVGTSAMLGKVVVVAHKDMHTVYANLDSIHKTIVLGKVIDVGTELGSVDDILIFQVTQDKMYVNPLDLIEL